MSNILTQRWRLSRRHLLRGLGATVALPLLDAMLRTVREGDEALLDRTMVLFGRGMSFGHSHCNSNLPILLAGGRGLGLKHGRHLDYNRPHLAGDYTLSYDEWRALCGKPKDEKARLSNVPVTMLQKMEVKAEQFVDSLGPVSRSSNAGGTSQSRSC
jgi:hypothetical protein